MAGQRSRTRWISASNAAGQFELFMSIAVQGLGSLDTELTNIDAYLVEQIALPEETRNGEQEGQIMTRHATLSYLWVLGAYEIVRSINQRFFNGDQNKDDPADIRITKRAFERLRMPLAKFEAAARSPNDSSIAYPYLNTELGMAWRIAEDTIITRSELADAFLQMLEDLLPNSARTLRD